MVFVEVVADEGGGDSLVEEEGMGMDDEYVICRATSHVAGGAGDGGGVVFLVEDGPLAGAAAPG